MKTKGIKEFFSKFLTNKIVLHIVFFLAFFNVIYYIIYGNLNAFIFYVILGVITTYFSKNMIIVLGLPLIVVNFFMLGDHSINLNTTSKEGMKNNNESKNSDKSSNNNNKNQNQNQKPIIAAKMKKNSQNYSTSSDQGLPIVPLDDKQGFNHDESFKVGGNAKGKKYKVDYASTVEEAYDNLNQILGSDGIKNLTSDTQKLMQQQVQLAESMKSMEPILKGMAPLMKQAEGLLGSMSDSSSMGSIANIAQNLTSTLGGKKPTANTSNTSNTSNIPAHNAAPMHSK